MFCVGGVENRPESRRLHDHPRAHGGRGGGWQDTDRSFRSTGRAPRRTPATSRRRPPDDEMYGVWVESDNSDRSSRCVEKDGSKRRQEPRSVCLALGADRGSYQASRARNVRVANPAGRPVEVLGVYGLCERCGRRRTKGVRGPYMRCQTFFCFPVHSADHERDWPPCKVSFSGWQPMS